MTDSKQNDPQAGEKPAAKQNPAATTGAKAAKAANANLPDAKQDATPKSTGPSSPAATSSAASDSSQAPSKKNIQRRNTVQKQNSSGAGWGVLAVLISLLALAGTGYTWYQNQVIRVQQESQLSLGVSEIGGQVSRLGDSISRIQLEQSNVVSQSELTSKVLQLATSVDAEIRTLKNSQATLVDSIGKMGSDLQKGVDQYLLDEVSQLLRLANNSALFAGDVDSAINALSLADSQLKSLSDPRYSVVRSKINEEITQLRSTQRADVEGLSAALSAIAAIVPSLPLANEPEAQSASVAEVAPESPVTWRTELKKLWRDVLGAVQIQRVDRPPKPLLVPQQRYFLNQNLQLMLGKAELSLMQGEAGIFKRSITESITWLNDYFDLSDERVNSVLNQLTEISRQSVDAKLPSITGSYQALQDIKGGS